MTKESKIKAIIGKPREFKGEKDSTFYFTVEMENGDKGQIGKKAPDAIKVGDELKYTIEENKNGYVTLREFKEGRGGYKGSFKPSTASVALGFATNIAVANIARSDKPMEMNEALAGKITALADHFNKWLKNNE